MWWKRTFTHQCANRGVERTSLPSGLPDQVRLAYGDPSLHFGLPAAALSGSERLGIIGIWHPNSAVSTTREEGSKMERALSKGGTKWRIRPGRAGLAVLLALVTAVASNLVVISTAAAAGDSRDKI